MNLPRRTTEFHEDAYGEEKNVNKRQTRGQSRPTVTPTPSKRGSVLRQGQSRLQPLSLERDRATLLGPISSTIKSTPSVTPMRQRNTSVERAVPLHNDKKWVQEQAQQIASYIFEMQPTYVIQGLPQDFFRRYTLRQISTKQFVGIVSFFLRFIWGNRFPIGSNHIEDITNALQRLNYPHLVSKSWLSTPTTQHSFGHVVVMLDFLKDFAPMLAATDSFPFVETAEQPSCMHNTTDATALSTTQLAPMLLDAEFKAQFFADVVASFMPWNTYKWDEYKALQRKDADILIGKRCDLADVAALEADIARAQAQLQQLVQQLAVADNIDKKQQQLQELRTKRRHVGQKLSAAKADAQSLSEERSKLCASAQQTAKAMAELGAQLEQLKRQVAQQRYTQQQFEHMRFQLGDVRHEAEMYERQLREQTEHSLNQQVMLSRAKKSLLDQLEQFNSHIRDMHYAGICSAGEADELALALPLQQSAIEGRVSKIRKLGQRLAKKHAQLEQRRKQLHEDKKATAAEKVQIELSQSRLNGQIKQHEQQVLLFIESSKLERTKWEQQQLQLEEQKCALDTQLDQLRRQNAEIIGQLELKTQQNDAYLQAAEQRHAQIMKTRSAQLDEYEELLAEGEAELKALNETLERNSKHLDQARQQLEQAALPESATK